MTNLQIRKMLENLVISNVTEEHMDAHINGHAHSSTK